MVIARVRTIKVNEWYTFSLRGGLARCGYFLLGELGPDATPGNEYVIKSPSHTECNIL